MLIKKNSLFNRSQFNQVLDSLPASNLLNYDLIYAIYETTWQGIDQLNENQTLSMEFRVNQIEIIYYCVGEFLYTSSNVSKEILEQRINDEKYISSIASVVADKYLSLSLFNHSEQNNTNYYLPPISSLNLYLNFILNILNNYEKNDPQSTLITDLLIKSVSIARCIIDLLTKGYETEAFSSWRTLHECECALVLLEKYGLPLINRYLIHMQYGIVFKNGRSEDELSNRIFADMKREMVEFNLKSKDIKKYIEYGWLYEIPEIREDENFKLNFRDGLEKYAGLENYNDRYELSSEIIHSTPMLIYSNKKYFYYITLLSTYESFFRLEKIFVSLFSKRVSEEQMKQYETLRQVYYSQLINIHKRESFEFQKWQEKKRGC